MINTCLSEQHLSVFTRPCISSVYTVETKDVYTKDDPLQELNDRPKRKSPKLSSQVCIHASLRAIVREQKTKQGFQISLQICRYWVCVCRQGRECVL